jgi:hypothetical protein
MTQAAMRTSGRPADGDDGDQGVLVQAPRS